VSVTGWAIVSIPSDTTPRFWKNVASAHMIQPVIPLSRRVSAVPAATIPTEAEPAAQSQIAQPITPAIRSPLSLVSAISIKEYIRISRWKVSRVRSMASLA